MLGPGFILLEVGTVTIQQTSIELFLHAAKSKSKYVKCAKILRKQGLTIQSYADMVSEYKSKCPVPVEQCGDIANCPSKGVCANVMFDPLYSVSMTTKRGWWFR